MKLRFAFTKPKDIAGQFEMLINALIAEIARQVEQDIPIWEHKLYRPTPILCDGDGPIAKYRAGSASLCRGAAKARVGDCRSVAATGKTGDRGSCESVRELRSPSTV